MKFIRLSEPSQAAPPLLERLRHDLGKGLKVLWLVSGGSNVPISTAVMQGLPAELTSGLTVMTADERYGAPGHMDSNWHKLEIAGFPSKQARLVPVLQAGLPLEATAKAYAAAFQEAAAAADVIVAQLGIGSDGHIAGILPGSSAVESADLIAAYPSVQFERLTLTPKALAMVTAAYAFAFGADKRPSLAALQSRTLSVAQQPAQLLKHLPEAYVYNDQIGDAE